MEKTGTPRKFCNTLRDLRETSVKFQLKKFRRVWMNSSIWNTFLQEYAFSKLKIWYSWHVSALSRHSNLLELLSVLCFSVWAPPFCWVCATSRCSPLTSCHLTSGLVTLLPPQRYTSSCNRAVKVRTADPQDMLVHLLPKNSDYLLFYCQSTPSGRLIIV